MKKIVMLSTTLLVTLTLLMSLFSCAAKFSEKDQALAEQCALDAVADYYNDDFKGKSVGSGKYTEYKSEVLSKNFIDGQYVIVVKFSYGAKGVNKDYPSWTTWGHMDLEYTIEVKNDKAKIINKEYLEIY